MNENLKLLLLFLAYCSVVVARIAVEENGFTTPDSEHYLASAKALLENGSFTYTWRSKTSFFSLWPIGYPASIALLSKLTPLSLFWSSKVINLIWLGIAFQLVRNRFPAKATWICLAFCTSSLLDIYSFTWSEGGFMVAMLWISFSLHQLVQSKKQIAGAIQLLVAGLSMFLYRYVGGFVLSIITLAGVVTFFQKKYLRMALFMGAGALLGISIGAYFWYIHQHTGHYSGATRQEVDEPLTFLLQNLLQAQANELLIIRKFPFHSLDALALFMFLVQVGLLGWAFVRARKSPGIREQMEFHRTDTLPLIIAFVGIVYWWVLVTLRLFIMKFDFFDFRVLAPASLLLLVALHIYFAAEHRTSLLQRIQMPLTLMYILALAHGLYKKNLLNLLLHSWS